MMIRRAPRLHLSTALTRNLAVILALSCASAALATTGVDVVRRDDQTVTVHWVDSDPVDIFIADQPAPVAGAVPVIVASRSGEATIALAATERRYVVVRDGGDGSLTVAGERLLPLQQGSNFRDIGGYVGAGGKHVRWGSIYRSGALPMLTDRDYTMLGTLGLDSIIDLRSLEERGLAPDQLDDRTGALFIANDYSIGTMMRDMRASAGGHMYDGFAHAFAPQYRAIFRRLLAHDGAVLYHCSAGQDRTGVATALILSALGVDRATIIADYHQSTADRRPQFEMPPIVAADHPGNMMAQYYAGQQARPDGPRAEPLYTTDGQSHIVQFLDYIDSQYGGIDGYLTRELGLTAQDIVQLRALYLE